MNTELENGSSEVQLLRLIDAAEFTTPSAASARLKLWEIPLGFNLSSEQGVWFGEIESLTRLLCGWEPGWSCSVFEAVRQFQNEYSVANTLGKLLGRLERLYPDRIQKRSGPGRRGWQIRAPRTRPPQSVLQPWVLTLSMMQQTVLLTAVRGPDGHPKYGPVKLLLRWYRRCLLLSALDGEVLGTPYYEGGGSFTGPSCKLTDCVSGETDGVSWISWMPPMYALVDDYLRSLDALPHHFQLHFLHAIEIMGYKHPAADIASFWASTYIRLVNDMHLHPESEDELDVRLGDSREGWLARADPATAA